MLNQILADERLVKLIQLAVDECLLALADGDAEGALLFANKALEVAENLQTKEAQGMVWAVFLRLDSLLVQAGLIEDEAIVCTAPPGVA